MNITTILEIEQKEIERLLKVETVFYHDTIDETIRETCVTHFRKNEKKEEIEDVMEELFKVLKQEGKVPSNVKDYSFEMPSCSQIKKEKEFEPVENYKIVISYSIKENL